MSFWRTQRGAGVLLIVLLGLLGTFGPYLYTQIAFATLAGWLVFKHVPDALAWLGIAVIAASGVGNAVLSAHELARRRGAATTPSPAAPPAN